MNWKQPIPTDLDQIFGKDKRAKQMYKELIYCACNTDGIFTDSRGKQTPIQRGQVVYGRHKFAEELGWDDKTTDRSLIRVQDVYSLVTMQRTKNFTIVSIKNYDEITGMTMQMTKQRPSNDQAMTTSKNVKSVKKEKNNTCEEILSLFQEMTGRKTRVIDEKAVTYWMSFYSLEEIKQAIRNIPSHEFWKDKMTPIILFRKKNPQGDAVDWIGQLLNRQRKEIDFSSLNNVL